MKTKEIKLVDKIVQHSNRRYVKKQTSPAIQFKNLVVDFGETLAVDNLSLKINQGELVTLLGPSGCGKTTTLNAIAGLLIPTSGKILFRGKDVTKLTPQKRELGLVFQNYALYPHMTVYKNIAFPLLNDKKWQEKRIKENEINEGRIEKIIFKSNGASDTEVKNLFKDLLAIYDIKRETLFYLNKVESKLYSELNTANAMLDVVKPHLNGAKARAHKKALKSIEKLDVLYKVSKELTKQEYNEKLSEIKKILKDELHQAKLDYKLEHATAKKAIDEAKKNMAKSKYKDELVKAKRNISVAPKVAREKYVNFRKELIAKYSLKRTSLSELDIKKISEFEAEIKPLKKQVHEAVLEVANKLDITKNLQKLPTKLSGGQQQRVAIARAIVKKPDILLMDEPLSNLDAKLRIEARNWIRGIQQDLGITLVFVTHDQEEAMSISDTVICLNEGKVQQMGSPMELYSKPANQFVATFLGMPEMKLFNAVVSSTGMVKVNSQKVSKVDPKYAGQNIKVGVRSEIIKISKSGIPAKIESVEQLGKDTLIHAQVEKHGMTNILLPGSHDYKAGQEIKISFNDKKIHLFDEEGMRI